MAPFAQGRRSRIVVDKRFQYRATSIGVTYILAAALLLSLPLINMLRSTSLLLEGHSQELIQLYRGHQSYTIIALSVFFVGLMVAWTLFTLWRTHKVAGPVIKITRYLHDISAGKFSQRVKLRSKDELQALADSLNVMAEDLEEREREMKDEILGQIQEAKQELYSNPSAERSVHIMEKLTASIEKSFGSKPAFQQQTGSRIVPQEEFAYSEGT